MKKKLASLALALVMALALLPTAASAAEPKSVKAGGITLSDVVVTDKYETAQELLDDSVPEYEFLYSLGMIGVWQEDIEEYGYGSFWCYIVPDDAEINFDLSGGKDAQVDLYTLKRVPDSSFKDDTYQADFVSGWKPADSVVDTWGVNRESIADAGDYDVLACWSGGDGPYYVAFASDFPPPAEFIDTPSWCAKEARWAVKKGITKGYGGQTTFAPGVECSQQEILTFLWRAAGELEAKEKSPFTVASWYQDAVDWAYEEGYIGDGFQADAPCTRAQAVTYILKALGEKEAGKPAGFPDVAEDASYAAAADWAYEKGVVKSYGGTGDFAPDIVCSRGQIACMLYRAYN